MSTKTIAKAVAAAFLAIALALTVAACNSSSKSSVKGAAASAAANPTVAAELVQAKALVKACFPAKPTAQIHTVHLVFLSSATGKHGAEVVVAREKLFNCLGVPRDRQDSFKNDAITAAEHQHPKILSLHPLAGVQAYLTITLPQLVLKYKGTAAGVGTSTAQPAIPGTTVPASPSAS